MPPTLLLEVAARVCSSIHCSAACRGGKCWRDFAYLRVHCSLKLLLLFAALYDASLREAVARPGFPNALRGCSMRLPDSASYGTAWQHVAATWVPMAAQFDPWQCEDAERLRFSGHSLAACGSVKIVLLNAWRCQNWTGLRIAQHRCAKP